MPAAGVVAEARARPPARGDDRRRAIIAAVIPLPLLLFGVGLAALAGAAVIFRSFGPGLRIGRLLAVTPAVSVAEAIDRAKAGRTDYVRLDEIGRAHV